MSPGLTSFFWFLAILVMIPLALWLLKRTPAGGGASGAGAARTVGVTPLSASQRLVTVEVGHGEERLWLVLGVTASSIHTLHTMTPPPGSAPTAAPTQAATFTQLLTRLRHGERGNDAR